MLSVTSLVIGALVLTYLIKKIVNHYELKRFARKHGCLPLPRATYWPLGINLFLENMQAVRDNRISRAFHERHIKFGETYSSNMLGEDSITTRDPENIKAMLATQFQDFDLSNRVGGKIDLLLGNNGIFTQNGAAWVHTRAMLRPQFSKGQIVNDMDSLELHVNRMISLFPNDRVFDIQPFFFSLTLDTATEFLFGESVESLLSERGGLPSKGSFGEAFNTAQFWISLKLKAGNAYWFIGTKDTKRACDDSRNYVAQFVDRALAMDLEKKKKEGKTKYVFLDTLAEVFNDRTVLTDQILNILLAGRDTTAGLLSFTMWFLARNKRVWNKLRQEVLESVGKDEQPTWEVIKDMKYLKYVLNESESDPILCHTSLLLSLTNILFVYSPSSPAHRSTQ